MAVLPLRHFSPVEFRCKCGCGAGMEKMDADLLQMLDEAVIWRASRSPFLPPTAAPNTTGRSAVYHLRAHSRLCRGYPLRGFPFPFRHPSGAA